ncbi:MAG: hypothetical protein H6508_07930 [Calditrichaeota bacterium]|nr:hypothetical protein [Calditrichota bacterium]MCB9367090.1 hypothetical protein [Calditrichota bacterium]
MRISSVVGVMLFCPLFALSQLHSVTAVEYYFDMDPGQGNGIPITVVSGEEVLIDGDIATSGLSPGVHELYVRMQRDDGVWGEPVVRRVRVGVGTEFDQAEAFFDSDPGVGNGTPVSVASDGVINLADFSVPDIGRGFHDFNVRVHSGGTWSVPAKRTLRLGSALIDGAEAFFDSDPGEGNGVPVNVGYGTDVAAYDSTVEVAAAGTGFHTVYLRFRGGGVWTFPTENTLRIGPAVDGGEDRIVGGEFFVDVDPGLGNGCPLLPEDGMFDDPDELMRRYISADFSLGQHVIGVRARDAASVWTETSYDTVQVVEAHLACSVVETPDKKVRLVWTKFPEAIEYHVHFDSLTTGTFTNYLTVEAPDTLLDLTPANALLLYRVSALQIAPEPCAEPAVFSRATSYYRNEE